MRFIVDTNRIMAALIRDGVDRKILTSQSIEFFVCDFIYESY